MTEEIKVTPSEELVLEVLAARWRLGESLWTFNSNQKRILDSLANKGLIATMHGIVENSLRASLTEAGKKWYWEDKIPTLGETTAKPAGTSLSSDARAEIRMLLHDIRHDLGRLRDKL